VELLNPTVPLTGHNPDLLPKLTLKPIPKMQAEQGGNYLRNANGMIPQERMIEIHLEAASFARFDVVVAIDNLQNPFAHCL